MTSKEQALNEEQKSGSGPYTMTVYVAAPGTPVVTPNGTSHPSQAGHLYYSVNDGKTVNGYGFAPIVSGLTGPGEVSTTDHLKYRDPLYQRTMEISKDQHAALKNFGDSAVKGDEKDFSLEYHGATNSCIDFVWAGLDKAGLHMQVQLSQRLGGTAPSPGYDGSLKPKQNILDLQAIPDPMPGSPLNQSKSNPMPDRSFKQWFLTENGEQRPGENLAGEALGPQDPSHPQHAVLQQIQSNVRALDEANGRPFDQRSEQLSHSLLTLARDNGMTRVDHVVYSRAEGRHAVGEDVFVVQGRLNDPAHVRASVNTELAASTPVAESNRQLAAVEQRLEAQQAVPQQALAPSKDQGSQENPHVMRG